MMGGILEVCICFMFFLFLVLYVSYFARSDLVVIEDPYVIVYK